jgi:transposase
MKEKTTGAKCRKYDASFKEEVLKMVSTGHPVSEVAQSLGIGEKLIYKLKSRNGGKEQEPVTISRAINATSQEDQQALLRKRIRELEQERDILKEALGIPACRQGRFSHQT